ncbi:MAG TPA: endopeptidase La [Spirochaetia bacterium]|nr:endopeptidase La [Spirochaetia bacterium]
MSLIPAFRGGPAVELPLVYARESVVFPKAVTPLLAATKFAAAAVDEALRGDKRIVAALLKGLGEEKGSEIEVHPAATVSRIVQQVRMPDGSIRLLVEGEARVRIKKTVFRKDHLSALVEPIEEEAEDPAEAGAALRLVKRSFAQYAELVKKLPAEALGSAERAEEAHELCDLVANLLPLKPERKIELLAIASRSERLEAVEAAIESEMELVNLQRKIGAKVKNRIDRNQREYFLNEQLKEINRELGKEGEESEAKELERALVAKKPPEEVLAKARRELGRLAKLQPFSPEAGVLRVYCEWLADLPWSERSQDNRDLERAKAVLDEDHYGMRKPKERILEFIAVRQLSEAARSPILCLVGPPGTGKTSLGRSVARALGRNFVRASLGGLRDEAEIRGHRKTYVGALPGKIIQSMKKAGTVNPVFLLDEIDKMSSDFRGDPASALLEVLDPEQNSSFTDHYVELPYDLSKVMFITTANSLHGIPYPLLDRMEIIEIPGYSEYEKLEIAKKFIVPKQLAENGLGGARLRFRDEAILEIVRHYTMESGVRSLEREIARVMRKLAQEAVEKGLAAEPDKLAAWSPSVTEKRVAALLGKRRREDDVLFKEGAIGVAYGLAWTETGGTLLPVEALSYAGTEGLILTGNLGDVMKESARAALSFIRSKAADLGLSESDFHKRVLHIHVPEGAIPKDGPSAGVTLVASLVSALSGRPLAPGLAMTGEITLTGRVLPVGGVKEKVLAARRNSIGRVILPEGNRKDLDELPAEIRDSTEFLFVASAEEALAILLPPKSASKRSAKVPARARKTPRI